MTDGINPLTALMRVHPPLPMTLRQMLDHLAAKSEDSGAFALLIDDADLSHSPECFDLEMIDELQQVKKLGFSNRMEYYACARIGPDCVVPRKILEALLEIIVDNYGHPNIPFFVWENIARRAFLQAKNNNHYLPRSQSDTSLIDELWEVAKKAHLANPIKKFGDRELMSRWLCRPDTWYDWTYISNKPEDLKKPTAEEEYARVNAALSKMKPFGQE